MTKYSALSIRTKYWSPGEDYLSIIVESIKKNVKNNDYVILSEKAISTAMGNYIDENIVNVSLTAKLISRFWMRISWGYIFGFLCHFGRRLIQRLREYPLDEGSRHKQIILQYAGFWEALMWGSEGGIDGSNLPYAFVSLPLKNPTKIAKKIYQEIQNKLNKKVIVIIVDTDKTYTFRNFHFTPHSKTIIGIHSFGGWIAYSAARALKLKKKSTPIAIGGSILHTKKALTIANIADKVRGSGTGTTVWDMAARFNIGITEMSWKMIKNFKHKPIVIIREKNN